MLVRGYWFSKCNIAQILQGIRKWVVGGISRFPEMVALRELFWSEAGQTQQIVRSVLDHVDPQIVARVNTEVRPVRVSQCKAFQFNQPIEGRMFHSLDLGNIHQSTHRLGVEDLTAGREHRSQFKGQYVR